MLTREMIITEARHRWPNTYRLLEINTRFCDDTFEICSLCDHAYAKFTDDLDLIGKFPFMDAIEAEYENIYAARADNKKWARIGMRDFPNILRRIKIEDCIKFGRGLVQVDIKLRGQIFKLSATAQSGPTKVDKLEQFLARLREPYANRAAAITMLPQPITEEILENY